MRKKAKIGERFGRLVVLSEARAIVDPKRGWRVARWLCLCDCGNKKRVRGGDLNQGKTTSCGCYKRERTVITHTKHGKRWTKTYYVWLGMRSRCANPKRVEYKNYGGRGIKVCSRWDSFSNFLKDMGEQPKGKQLDRINNNGGYSPENCRWATRKQQMRNTRGNRYFTIHGNRKSLSEWCEISNQNYMTVWHKLKRGADIKTALQLPPSTEPRFSP